MFKGLGNLGNITSMVGALQQLPDRMKDLNERMKDEEVSASSSCTKVVVVMNGVGHVRSVGISVEATDSAELERAVQEATNEAHAAAKKLYADAVHEMVNDMNLNIPGIEGMISSFTGNR